jgi:predicted deacetylase
MDDACSTMHHEKWNQLEVLFDAYQIKPMVGIVPNNKDIELMPGKVDENFYVKALQWQKKGWTIALHGYEHLYNTTNKGLNPVLHRSEYSGLPLAVQEEKIEKGYALLKNQNLKVDYFFAPSHNFDENTLKALYNKTTIRKISDTIASVPYKKGEFAFFPLQFGKFRNIKSPGYWTFCLHPNSMKEIDLFHAEQFIKKHHQKFISFDEVNIANLKNKTNLDKFLSWSYFLRRNIVNSISKNQ